MPQQQRHTPTALRLQQEARARHGGRALIPCWPHIRQTCYPLAAYQATAQNCAPLKTWPMPRRNLHKLVSKATLGHDGCRHVHSNSISGSTVTARVRYATFDEK